MFVNHVYIYLPLSFYIEYCRSAGNKNVHTYYYQLNASVYVSLILPYEENEHCSEIIGTSVLIVFHNGLVSYVQGHLGGLSMNQGFKIVMYHGIHMHF